jgi:hypothetical protein
VRTIDSFVLVSDMSYCGACSVCPPELIRLFFTRSRQHPGNLLKTHWITTIVNEKDTENVCLQKDIS